MPCLTLPPLSACGFGRCVNNSCVCDPGVIQSTENLFVPVSANETIICDYSPEVVLYVSISLLVLTCVTLCVQLLVVQNCRQFKRLIPVWVGYPMLIIAYSLRIAFIEEPLWGINGLFTFCLAGAILVQSYAYLIFLNKYLSYLAKTFDLTGKYKRFSEISYNIDIGIAVLLFISTALWVLPCWVDSLDASKLMTQIASGIYAAAFTWLTGSAVYILSKYIADMQMLVSARVDRAPKQVIVPTDFEEKCLRQIPKIKSMRISVFLGSFMVIVATLPCLFLELWIKRLPFILFITQMFYLVANICIIRAFNRKAFPSFRPLMTLSSRPGGSGQGSAVTLTDTSKSKRIVTRTSKEGSGSGETES